MFKRTVGVSCSLKESIDGLEIIICGKMFHCTIVCGKNDHLYVSFCVVIYPYTHDNINKLEMVQRRAARYVQNNYHNTSSVTSMIDTLGWPTLAERRLKTRLIMLLSLDHF
jgi:hypothetical protein